MPFRAPGRPFCSSFGTQMGKFAACPCFVRRQRHLQHQLVGGDHGGIAAPCLQCLA